MNLAEEKERLRQRALERRAARKDEAPALSRRMADIFLSSIPIVSGAAVSAYRAIGEEADPEALIEGLRARGHPILLPRVVGRGKPLDFHLYAPGATLVRGGFGLSEPAPDWPKRDPDMLIVPLLGFDKGGYRIGYGAGFYDRTLSKLRQSGRAILAVGYAFSVQEFDAIPHDENDERLDWVVTEKGAWPL